MRHLIQMKHKHFGRTFEEKRKNTEKIQNGYKWQWMTYIKSGSRKKMLSQMKRWWRTNSYINLCTWNKTEKVLRKNCNWDQDYRPPENCYHLLCKNTLKYSCEEFCWYHVSRTEFPWTTCNTNIIKLSNKYLFSSNYKKFYK